MSKFIKKDLSQAQPFHGTLSFIEDLCAINDRGEF